MNVDQGPVVAITPAVWESPEVRRALAARDMKTVFELLVRRCGISQREIGRRAGLTSSEIFQVLKKNRRVTAYEVLAKIADGLEIPRGYMGLAYGDGAADGLDLVAASFSQARSEREEVRDFLSRAATITMGTDSDDIARWWQPLERETSPVPGHIGDADIDRIESLTAAMRTLDYRYGGGACRDAIAAQVRWAQQLLNATAPDATMGRLKTALADLHNLAGWTSFDVGMYSVARRHFLRALQLAYATSDHSLAANVLYRTGRLHLHREMPDIALRFFQLGQIAAQDSGSALTVSLLCANEAWTYAALGHRQLMDRSLKRAEDEFARAQSEHLPAWIRFFGEADLNATAGVALASLPTATAGELTRAVDHLTASLSLRGPEMTRSRVFEHTALATALLRAGDRTGGLHHGRAAVTTASTVRSIRIIDRLAPLTAVAERHRRDPDVRDLIHDIDALKKLV
ncbi:helix-turn-helix transcriptional regulator [Nocardia cyriacigeorgica]|uniref:Helix-turn-helix transcriptional regulator n=1 Tax=Nocardia cyriacigeorgica TaxID=135487 RepID=A0A5R8P9E4_9NOCA|nr:helix-turn-helix transcriptional regulator [Nocardia cyriacigeorgica]TLG01766.1 helix-turn-helix transcriptional regulator [Nocardia cyriacigeorgica]